MAARKNRAALLLKQKEAKQKKLLFALVPVFLLLVAWQGPKMYKALFSSPQGQATPASTTTTPATPTPTPQPSPEAEVGGLPDTDLLPEAGPDQLISFSRFTGRDPFVQQDGGSGSSSGSSGQSSGGTSGGSSGGTGGSGGSGGEEAATSAVIEINGSQEILSVGSAFPASNPTFTLNSLTSDSAVIGLVQGMFEDGSSTVEIALGEQVVLVSAPDSTQYTIELLSIN
jgi:hypothetical protein